MKFLSCTLPLLLLPLFANARVGIQDHATAMVDVQNMQTDESSRALQSLCKQCKTIYVAFHLLQDSSGTGNTATLWTDAQIASEIENLNDQWEDTSFKFELRPNSDAIDRQTNDGWNQGDLRVDSFLNPIASQLRVGGPTTVNVFINDGPVCEIAGWATQDLNINMFPVDEFVRTDRISICGKSIHTDHTFIMSHEIGHWMGLKHTFEGGCSGDGDGIDDTPAQAIATVGCPESVPNSCGSPDPINNFMDYSSCDDKTFTSGQNSKMYESFVEFRERSIPCADDEAELGFEISFDNDAWRNKLIITKWGVPPNPQNFQIMDNNVDYANKMALYRICFPKNTMYEVKMTDSGNDGIQSPGYFKYSLNGVEVYSGSSWSGRNSDSVLISGGQKTCGPNQGRFKLELKFDSRPTDTTWELRTSSGTFVVDQSATTYSQTPGGYITNFVGFLLIFDQCLDNVPHEFTIRDSNGDGITSGYFNLYVNGARVHAGAGNSFTQSTTIQFPVAALPPADNNPGGDEPTPPPSPQPTPQPTAAPVAKPSTPGFGCFSRFSTVQVMGSGLTKLADLKLGDHIHVGKNVYEPVYSFGHFNVNAKGDFLEIKTEKSTLQLTQDHMVFTASGAIPASMVQIGDLLMDGQGETREVQSIKNVISTGAIAPFTPSGKVVVDGVLASSFVAFGSESHLSVVGIKVPYQWLAHSFEAPHRLFCNHLTQCLTESYDMEGVSQWVATPHRLALWMMQQTHWLRTFMSVVAFATLAIFNIIEFIVLHPLSAAVGLFTVCKFARRGGVKQL